MSIFDKVKKGMLDSTKTIKEISSEMTEMTRLKVALSKEKAQLDELYYNLGKALYSTYEQHVNTKELPEAVVDALTTLKQAHIKISEYENRIEFLKGVLKCTHCGTEVDEDAKFCSNCGNQLTFVLDDVPITSEFQDVLEEEIESITTVEDLEEEEEIKEPEL